MEWDRTLFHNRASLLPAVTNAGADGRGGPAGADGRLPGRAGEGHQARAAGAERQQWMPKTVQKQNLYYIACFHFHSHISFIAIFISIATFYIFFS